MNNATLKCGKTQIKNVKALLKLYRKILFSVNNNICELDDEIYVTSRKHLMDIVDPLVEFDTQYERDLFAERVNQYHKSLSLLGLLDKAAVLLNDYPVNGRIYYDIISRYYFDNFKYTHEELISILEMSRTNYYRYFDQAIICYYKLLIPLLKSENYDINDDLVPVNYD